MGQVLKAQSISFIKISNYVFIDIEVVDMNAPSKDVSNIQLARSSDMLLRRNAYLNELQLRTTCPIESSKKWWDTDYVLYDLAKPPSKTDWYVDSSSWEF